MEYKTILNTNDRYLISDSGILVTLNWKGSGKRMEFKPALDKKGYLRTAIIINGKASTIKLHRLVAQAFIPNPKNKPQVNHINGIKNDNRVENLEWCTGKENVAHAIKNGFILIPTCSKELKARGSKNGQSKLTECQVLEIRAKFKPYVYTRYMLAKEYNVKPTTIKDVILRSWKHI